MPVASAVEVNRPAEAQPPAAPPSPQPASDRQLRELQQQSVLVADTSDYRLVDVVGALLDLC